MRDKEKSDRSDKALGFFVGHDAVDFCMAFSF
jgi:hypothetical protein